MKAGSRPELKNSGRQFYFTAYLFLILWNSSLFKIWICDAASEYFCFRQWFSLGSVPTFALKDLKLGSPVEFSVYPLCINLLMTPHKIHPVAEKKFKYLTQKVDQFINYQIFYTSHSLCQHAKINTCGNNSHILAICDIYVSVKSWWIRLWRTQSSCSCRWHSLKTHGKFINLWLHYGYIFLCSKIKTGWQLTDLFHQFFSSWCHKVSSSLLFTLSPKVPDLAN